MDFLNVEETERENNGIDKNAPQLRLWCEFLGGKFLEVHIEGKKVLIG